MWTRCGSSATCSGAYSTPRRWRAASSSECVASFGKGVKLRHDRDGSFMLLVPEGALVLNSAAAAALELVDGKRGLDEIVDAVRRALRRAAGTRARRSRRAVRAPRAARFRRSMNAPRPLSLLCELTYRCNLQCPYCYNPLALNEYRDELSTEQWRIVLRDAADLGVVQAHFSGGEPTLPPRPGIDRRRCIEFGLYTNLITQGTFLDDSELDRLLAERARSYPDQHSGAERRTRRRNRGTRPCMQKRSLL